MPDFEPIDRLMLSRHTVNFYKFIRNVVLCNGYVVCCNNNYVVGNQVLIIYKVDHSLINRLKGEGWIIDICVYNDIMYSREFDAVKSWNIETGQIIQDFRYNQLTIGCITA